MSGACQVRVIVCHAPSVVKSACQKSRDAHDGRASLKSGGDEMIFDVILALCLLFFSLSVCSLFFIVGYLAHGEYNREVKREKKTERKDGWDEILNYNHRKEGNR